MIRILLVEDDQDLNRTVCRHLTTHDYLVTGCSNVEEAYDALYSEKYDLIISDILMPRIDGFEFAKTVREDDPNIPIIFMTSKEDYSSKKKGFNLGIDDYLVKPMDLNELLLHITAILRRSKITSQRKITVGNLELDEEGFSITLDGEPVQLTTREFQLLFKLLSYPNRAFTRNQLLEEFGGIDNESGPRSIDVFITNIRAKMRDCEDFKIVTVRGIGYKAIIK